MRARAQCDSPWHRKLSVEEIDEMRRRDFIVLLGGAATGWPRIEISEARELPRIGVLMGISEGDAEVQPRLLAFRQVLQDLGWTEGRNVQIDYRFAVADP